MIKSSADYQQLSRQLVIPTSPLPLVRIINHDSDKDFWPLFKSEGWKCATQPLLAVEEPISAPSSRYRSPSRINQKIRRIIAEKIRSLAIYTTCWSSADNFLCLAIHPE